MYICIYIYIYNIYIYTDIYIYKTKWQNKGAREGCHGVVKQARASEVRVCEC